MPYNTALDVLDRVAEKEKEHPPASPIECPRCSKGSIHTRVNGGLIFRTCQDCGLKWNGSAHTAKPHLEDTVSGNRDDHIRGGIEGE